jgi:hypothetical protein
MESGLKVEPVYTKLKISEQKADIEYWRSQSFQARLLALEEIRREYHRWKYNAEPGFQRVYQIVKR